MKKEIIELPEIVKGELPFSHAVKAGNLIFLTSQLSCDLRTGKVVPGSVEKQTEKALENVIKVSYI